MKKLSFACAAVLGLVLGGSSCLYVADGIRQDARQAATIPQAIWDGAKRDIEIYRPVSTHQPERPPADR